MTATRAATKAAFLCLHFLRQRQAATADLPLLLACRPQSRMNKGLEDGKLIFLPAARKASNHAVMATASNCPKGGTVACRPHWVRLKRARTPLVEIMIIRQILRIGASLLAGRKHAAPHQIQDYAYYLEFFLLPPK